jgi:hypothetical protein
MFMSWTGILGSNATGSISSSSLKFYPHYRLPASGTVEIMGSKAIPRKYTAWASTFDLSCGSHLF